MMRIPIVFAIDKNVVVPCAVTITSLLSNAAPATEYDIYILCEEKSLPQVDRDLLKEAFLDNSQAIIHFVNVGEAFSDVPEMRRVTKATYYRLLIPELFPQFDKVIYSDIDIIFQRDLTLAFETSFPNDELIAAVLDLAIHQEFYFESSLPGNIGKSVRDYFNAGFLIMNLRQLRLENKVEEFKKLSKKKHAQNDQDILNIVCNGRVQWLDSSFNFQTNHYTNYMWGRKDSKIDFSGLVKTATLHYTFRNKPWCSLECALDDAWWHYYRMSPVFNNNFYFNRQYHQIQACQNDYHHAKSKTLVVNWLGRVKKLMLKMLGK